MRPYMCTPHSLHACRLIAALESMTFNFSSFAVTLRFSRGVTATCENSASPGFQHFVQPQTWLCAHWPLIVTVTLLVVHLHCSVPPAKFGAAGLRPLSTAGWIEIAMVNILLVMCSF